MTITFATLAIPPFWEKEATLLVESLRTFGGLLAGEPILILTRKGNPLSDNSVEKFETFKVDWAEFEMDQEAQNFPLAVVTHGAAAAERHLQGSTGLLAWLLPDTLILNEPVGFLLPADRHLGYRPVHHQNIGSDYNQPLDAFWQLIYQHCTVPEQHLFRMETCYREVVRPYFNAGILVTRPQELLMAGWLEVFQRTYQHPDFTPFFNQRKYAIFMHQAVLAGVILNKYPANQLAELPESYNYPLHLHANYPLGVRAATLNQLVTTLYENTRQLPEFLEKIQVNPPISNWLNENKLLG